MKNIEKVLIIFLFKKALENEKDIDIPTMMQFTSLLSPEILESIETLKRLHYLDDNNNITKEGFAFSDIYVKENKKEKDNLITGSHRVQVLTLMKVLKDREISVKQKLIDIKEIKNTHSWVVSGSHGPVVKSQWYPSGSNCKKCGMDFNNFKVMPQKCPK